MSLFFYIMINSSIMKPAGLILLVCFFLYACNPMKDSPDDSKPVKLITVDPGHFHAALVQKSTYETVDSTVYVYAPAGPDVDLHLDRIRQFNERPEQPTNWNEVVYKGDDFFERMLNEKRGNVVVFAGNNRKKTEYINQAVQAGFHVLADKPMVIDSAGFDLLKSTFEVATQNGVMLYDIMTERYEITTILQRELSQQRDLFGNLVPG